MTNERKLELTLCGMLPYGLKIKTSMGIIPLVKSNHTVSLMNGLLIEDVERNKNYLPLLHSLDKLTEPILDGGLIPIVELAKTAFKDWKWNIINNMCVSKIEEANYYFQFNEGVFECFSFNKGGGITGMYFGNHLNLFEKLKEWHFNIYDLPKEMYIEKSSVKI